MTSLSHGDSLQSLRDSEFRMFATFEPARFFFAAVLSHKRLSSSLSRLRTKLGIKSVRTANSLIAAPGAPKRRPLAGNSVSSRLQQSSPLLNSGLVLGVKDHFCVVLE
jgi:hypothetical protein